MGKITQLMISFSCLTSVAAFVPGFSVPGQASQASRQMVMTAGEEGLSRRELLTNSLIWSTGLATVGLNPQISEAAPSGSALDAALRGYAEKIRKLSRVLDEMQRDIFAEDWELIATYPGSLRSYVPYFTRYTDSKFSGETEPEKNSRVALRYEVGRLFGAVERLRRASDKKDIDEAAAAFSQISVAYDRYLKAGYLYDAYDPIVSTEVFYANFKNNELKYDSPTQFPPKIKDLVLILTGPDKGKTGVLIGIEESTTGRGGGEKKKSAVVKLDNTIGRVQKIKEIKVVPYKNIAKRELTDEEIAAASASASNTKLSARK